MRAREILMAVAAGELDVDQAAKRLETMPFQDVGHAVVDSHRAMRQGVPEVIFGQGKTTEQIISVGRALLDAKQRVLVTRIEDAAARDVIAALATEGVAFRHSAVARIVRLETQAPKKRERSGYVALVTGGTSDIPVAEEAAETLDAVGVAFERIYDVGVAGIHRLLHRVERLREASAVIAIAGMEGALPSVVGGIVAAPVIAVPTSIGYGTALGGLTPMFAMLTSCASGITVVNIDNGFGAALAVHRILWQREGAAHDEGERDGRQAEQE
ncbi:MAG: nickel pincer cofactor biosynthesis protein LarB [Polyangiaceae bacterium]